MQNMIHFLGMGVVASTKQTGDKQIMVRLPGMFPMDDGRNQATAQEQEQKSVDAQGNTVSSKTLVSNTMPAFWKSMGDTNRLTPPDVREGTEVAIYQITGQKKYYWTLWGVNAKTMRLETVIMGWSANPNTDENITEGEEDFNIDNFYTLMVSTHTGKITLRTAQKNGEKTLFELMIDAMAGKIMIGGKEKNYLMLDDIAHSFTYMNADGSIFNVLKEKISMYAKDSINLNGDKEINLLTKKLNIQCEQWQVKAASAQFDISNVWNVNVPTTNWKGNIFHVGDTEQTGSHKSTGEIHSDTDVTSDISLNDHKHPGVKQGSDMTEKGQ